VCVCVCILADICKPEMTCGGSFAFVEVRNNSSSTSYETMVIMEDVTVISCY